MTYDEALTAWARAKFPHVPWITGDVVTLRHVDHTYGYGCDTCGYGNKDAYYVLEIAGRTLAEYDTWRIPQLLAEILEVAQGGTLDG